MSLVKAQCTNCNGMLEVDSSKDAAICPHCGTPYIVDKAIQQFKIYNTNVIQNASFVGESEEKRLIDSANGYLKLGNFASAVDSYQELTRLYPHKFEYWWGLAKLYMDKNNTRLASYRFDKEIFNYAFENATKLANSDQKQMINSMYNSFENDMKDWSGLYSRFETLASLAEYLSNNKIVLMNEDKSAQIIPAGESLMLKKLLVDRGDKYWRCIMPIRKMDMKTGMISYDVVDHHNYDIFFDSTLKYSQERGEYIFQGRNSLNNHVETYIFKETVKKEGCYIATCVYGSYDCPEVWTLRRFRDNSLAHTVAGKGFIKAYYATSPTLVKWFGKTKLFQRFWRGLLDKMVKKLNEKGIEDTRYYD